MFYSARQLISGWAHHKNLEAMKSFNKNRIQASKVGKRNVRPSFFNILPQKSHAMAAAIIFAVIVLHFASQFIFFQNEDNRTANISPETISFNVEPAAGTVGNVEITPDEEAENIKIAVVPKPVQNAAVKTETEIAPSRTASPRLTMKKKEIRESKAERLRRAEKLLTGI